MDYKIEVKVKNHVNLSSVTEKQTSWQPESIRSLQLLAFFYSCQDKDEKTLVSTEEPLPKKRF